MSMSGDVRFTVYFEQNAPLEFAWEPRVSCYLSTAISACPYLQFKRMSQLVYCRGRITVGDAVDSLHHGANSGATRESLTWRQMTLPLLPMIYWWYVYVINTISGTYGV